MISKGPIRNTCSDEQPALGIVWANLITNSLHLYRKDGHRYLCTMNSSYLPRSIVEFEIRNIGVVGVE